MVGICRIQELPDVVTPNLCPQRLAGLASEILVTFEVPPADARLVADSLVQADLWGHQSHGVMRLSWYAARLQSGAMRAKTAGRFVIDGGAIGVVDGCDGIGQVLAAQGMRDAIARAKAHGIGAVGVRNSNHFGTAMYFTKMAAEAGCIGFLSTNASPAMAPWGGREKRVGTNPWSWAAPAGGGRLMMLDISNTGVARGKVYLAKQKGQAIPLGWALNAEGAPTTDPIEAISGIILPMGDHKGYGIATMMDVLAGVLTGSTFGAGVSGPYQADKRSGCGHFAIAIHIAAFQPLDAFTARMDTQIAALKAVPLAKGFDEVFYPGEPEARWDALNRREGIVLPADTMADLGRLALERGVAFDAGSLAMGQR